MNNQAGRLALKVALFYVIVAAGWIFFSDELVGRLFRDENLRMELSLFKGMGFVLVTGFLLYQFLYRLMVRWQHTEAARQAVETRYRKLFENMDEGVAYCRMMFQGGEPADFVYVAVNGRFAVLTGLKDVVGKRVTEVIPGLRESDPGLLEIYGRVVRTGKPEKLERYVEALKLWFNISVFCPEPEHFVVVFDVVNERKAEQAALRASELRFRTLLEQAPLAISISRDGISLYANQKFKDIFGLQNAGQWDGASIVDYYAPQCREACRERIRLRSLGQPAPAEFESVGLRADGAQFPVQVTVAKVRLPDGEADMGFVTDITKRQRAEEEVRWKTAFFEALVNSSQDGILVVDNQNKKIIQNRRMVDLWKFPPEIAGDPDDRKQYEFARGQTKDPAGFDEKNRQLVAQDDVQAWDEIELRDGTVLERHTCLVAGRNGEFYGRLWNFRDITGRKQIQEAHARLATAVEQAAESIVITDTAGVIQYVNPAFERNTGYAAAEALGRNPRLLKSGKQDAEFYRRMWAVLQRGETWNGHFTNRRKDGTLFEEEATISPIRDAAGKIVSFVAVKRDVTHEAELEAQFRQAQKMEAVGQLAGGVAHDFNNILAVIQMQAGLIRLEAPAAGDDAGTRHDYASEIEKACERAANLTNQLLLFSRKQPLQLRDHDLNGVVTSIAKMLQRVLGEHIQMQIRLSPQPLPVHADAGMMDQLLMNLTVNARDAMPKGGTLELETAVVEFDGTTAAQNPRARPGTFACLRVGDTGGGIAPEVLPRIFEPFFTTKGPGKGSGLGLATVFGIVQQHHGWIDVASEAGRGTSFRIYLPRLAAPAGRTADWPSFGDVRPGHETILLVEDDDALRETMRCALARFGYQMLSAANGPEAVAIWKAHRAEIRLLLTDLMMPGGVSGKELAERLLQEKAELKVIYASGYSADMADGGFPLKEGVNFLAKPFEMHQLARAVRNCLDRV